MEWLSFIIGRRSTQGVSGSALFQRQIFRVCRHWLTVNLSYVIYKQKVKRVISHLMITMLAWKCKVNQEVVIIEVKLMIRIMACQHGV